MIEENLQAFLAQNAIKAEETAYVASARFLGKDKKPIPWKIKMITADRDEELRNQCKKKSFIPGTRDQKVELDSDKYSAVLICECVTYPNLDDAVIQDSYGAIGAEDLIHKMLTPGEYTDLFMAVQQINGFQVGMDEKIKKAKN